MFRAPRSGERDLLLALLEARRTILVKLIDAVRARDTFFVVC